MNPLGFADQVPAKFITVKRKSLASEVEITQDGLELFANPLLLGRPPFGSHGDPVFTPFTPQTFMLSSKAAVPEYSQLMLTEDSGVDVTA